MKPKIILEVCPHPGGLTKIFHQAQQPLSCLYTFQPRSPHEFSIPFHIYNFDSKRVQISSPKPLSLDDLWKHPFFIINYTVLMCRLSWTEYPKQNPITIAEPIVRLCQSTPDSHLCHDSVCELSA